MTIGNRIKEARQCAGYTQRELAKKSNVATVTIQQYERGVRQPRLEQLRAIANALNVPIDYLLDIKSLPEREIEVDFGFKKQTSTMSSGAIEMEVFDDFLTELGFKTYIDFTRLREYSNDSEKNNDDSWIFEDTREKKFYTATTEDLNRLMDSILSFSKFQIYELVHRLTPIDEEQIGHGRQETVESHKKTDPAEPGQEGF